MNTDIAPYHILLRQDDGSTKTDETKARSAFEAQVQYQRLHPGARIIRIYRVST